MTYSPALQLGSILEVMADSIGDRPALITNDITLTYAELDDRVTRLANHLAANGVGSGDHVAVHASNCHQWVESFYACFKIRAVPINVNYRYVRNELQYIYENAECVAVIAEPRYTAAIDEVAADLPALQHRLLIGDEYEAALAAASDERNFEPRSDDDIYMVYTGGTTGMPKGVMWRNEDIIKGALNSGRQERPIESVAQLGEEAAATDPATQARLMAAGPMMHGGTQWATGNAHVMGGVMVLYTLDRYDAHEVLALAARAKANSMTTMGDAMARPLAEARLGPGGSDHDLSNLFMLSNAAAPLSTGVREQLRAAFPDQMLADTYGASETGSTGRKFDDGQQHTAPRFETGPETTVLDEVTGKTCAVGEVGKLARSGAIPLGYYKDEAKTAATFPTYDGKRWVIPGDFARIEDDGSISVLGRGSASINSGAEKIYPEEVEGALKTHDAVFDAAVIGTPSERWGQQVTALVQLRDGNDVSADDLRDHCRGHVADYKVPKDVLLVESVPRTEVGKVDYKGTTALALSLLGLEPA